MNTKPLEEPDGAAGGGAAAAAAGAGSGDAAGDVEAPATATTSTKWGIKVAFVPSFPADELRRVAARHSERLGVLQEANRRWTMAMDSSLVSYVDHVCEQSSKSPLDLSPEDVSPSADELLRFPELADVVLQDMQLRFLVLRNFNRRLMDLLPLVDLSRPDRDAGLASLIRQLRGLMLKVLKLKLFRTVLQRSERNGGDRKDPQVTINRHRAADVRAKGMCDVRGRRTVFGQIFQQLHTQPPEKLRRTSHAWYTVFAGEYADDYGGPYVLGVCLVLFVGLLVCWCVGVLLLRGVYGMWMRGGCAVACVSVVLWCSVPSSHVGRCWCCVAV